MKRLSPTSRLTVGAMASALGVLLMYLACVVPSGKLALCFLASTLIWIPLNARGGTAWALICYASTALITLFLVPNKLYALAYALFFGLYAFIKLGVDMRLKRPTAAFIAKLLMMNLLAAAIALLSVHLLGKTASELLPSLPILPMILALQIAFILYEIAFTFAIDFFDARLRRLILGDE